MRIKRRKVRTEDEEIEEEGKKIKEEETEDEEQEQEETEQEQGQLGEENQEEKHHQYIASFSLEEHKAIPGSEIGDNEDKPLI